MGRVEAMKTGAAIGAVVGAVVVETQLIEPRNMANEPLSTQLAVHSIGPAFGSVIGASLFEVVRIARKIGPVALVAVGGAIAGGAIGIPPCTIITAFSSDAPGTTCGQLMTVFSLCCAASAVAGGVLGVAAVKAAGLSYRAIAYIDWALS